METEHLSLITTPIELLKGGEKVCPGTGFFYVTKWNNIEHLFLVTNYHVLTRNDPLDRDRQPEGNSIFFYYHMDEGDPSYVAGIHLPLYTREGEKIWLEHQNENIDLAIIPLTFSLPIQGAIRGISKEWSEVDMVIRPADTVTVVGYPRMFFDKINSLPIYKTGSIASEPGFDFEGEACFIIDVSALKGNSGSPVFSLGRGTYNNSKGSVVVGEATKFLGVYSGGYKSKDKIEDFQLGKVWKADLIEDIIKSSSQVSHQKVLQKMIEEGGFKYKFQSGFKDVF